MVTRAIVLALYIYGLCFNAAGEPAAEACFQIYDEARPLLNEDFSLRLYRSGAALAAETRAEIADSNDQTRLSQTILNGGLLSLRDYTQQLTDRVDVCDQQFDIPATAKPVRTDDQECAGRYAALMLLARSPQQRVSFAERMRFATSVHAFRAETDEKMDELALTEVREEGQQRADAAALLERTERETHLLDMIFDVQACDGKYGHSLMLIPGTFYRMFGPQPD